MIVKAVISLVLLLFIPTSPEYYKLPSVKRVDQDLYKSFDGLYVETKLCYRYTYGEDAILKWNGRYSGDNKIIWSDDSSCQVESIWKK